MAEAILKLFQGQQEKTQLSILPGANIIVGRTGFEASIEINDDQISRKHATFIMNDEGLCIIDSSTNGTFINGSRIDNQIQTKLNNNDIIHFGNKRENYIMVLMHVENENIKNYNIPQKQHKSLSELLKTKSPLVIGRSETNVDVVVDDKYVSRAHAKVWIENDQVYVEDLNSSNGTFINSKRIFHKTLLKDADTLMIGLQVFRTKEVVKDLTKECAIQAIGLEKIYSYTSTGEGIGLHSIDLKIEKQEFIALMGPSGCGKSTLLKALNGDNPATKGKVLIHGLDLVENYQLLKRKIGYVPQDDIVHKELSVENSLYYAAKLRLGDQVTEEFIQNKINQVLSSLNINRADIRCKRVGSLSGGQRKRVSIAVELLNDPTILFLDEPTSPLDPETIEEFLKCIRNLTYNGTTVIMVTHKPEDLNYVDKVLFLTTKGFPAYFGEKGVNLLNYFSSIDIIGIYSLLSKEDKIKEIHEQWEKNTKHEDHILNQSKDIDKTIEESYFKQLYWLSRRYLKIKTNDHVNMALLVAQPLIIASLVAFIFKDMHIGILFLIAISAIWFGVSNAAKEIVSEIPIYKRERMFNMHISSYMLSKIFILTLFAAVQVFIFITIIYLRYSNDHTPGLNDSVQLGYYWNSALFMLYLSFSATLMGLVISSIFNNVEKVMTIVPITLMPQIMLAGIVTKLEDKFTEFMSYFMLGRWGTEGFARLQDDYYTVTSSTGNDSITGSVVTWVPELSYDTITSKQYIDGITSINTSIIPKETGEMMSSKHSALELLDLYNADKLFAWFQSDTMNYTITAITLINIFSFISIYIALRKKDTI